MNNKDELSSSLYVYLIIGFLVGSVLILSFMDSISKQDAWLVILTALLLCLPFILSYSTLSKFYPGKTLFEISVLVYGRTIGKFICALYLLYFLMLFSFNLRDLADFYTGYIMIETPKSVFLVVFVLCCAYAVKKGIQSIAKISIIAVWFSVITVVSTFLLLLSTMDFTNFLPVFELSPTTYFRSTSHFMIVPYCELAVFMMVMPKLKRTKKISKLTMIALCLAALILLAITVRNTAVLGPSTGAQNMASYQSVRLIHAGEFFTRIELLVGLGFTVTLFVKVCVLYYATVLGLSQLLSMQSYTPLIVPVGGILIVLAQITYSSMISHYEFALKYNVHLIALFEFILPPLTLFIAWLRRWVKKMMVKQIEVKPT